MVFRLCLFPEGLGPGPAYGLGFRSRPGELFTDLEMLMQREGLLGGGDYKGLLWALKSPHPRELQQ